MALQKKTRLENGEQFAFKQIGDSLKGYYVGTDEIETKYGRSKRHALQTKKDLVTFFGNAQLNQDLAEVPLGTYVEIEFTDEKKVKRGTMKIFDFSYDLDDVDAGGVAKRAAAVAEEAEDRVEVEAAESDVEEEEERVPPKSQVTRQPAKVDNARVTEARALLGNRRR